MVKAALFSTIRAAGLMPAIRRFTAGKGAILMFHEVHDEGDHELRTGTSTRFLDYVLGWLKRNGWEIVSLDECAKRVQSNIPGSRFASLTFDDGYRDNVTRALPILEHHCAPFTVYVPTGAPTRTLNCWWLGLRELFRKRDIVEIEPMGRRFECATIDRKIAALDEVCRWIHQDYRRKESLASTFEYAGISLPELNRNYFLDEHEIRELATHPLASIGGHTSSHAALSCLHSDLAFSEMVENRRYLEQLLHRPVAHFAFPYGNPRACGEREFALAAKAGFSTAVTTEDAPLLARKCNSYSLPRVSVLSDDTSASFDAKVSGLRHVVSSMARRKHIDSKCPVA
jgi:peptidoglycan/xylan/chitin deacetylase (PgdA/CDA1 family)